MRILVACEFSQIVTKAFRERGHEGYSCDLLPTEGNPDWHIQDDVLKHLDDGWDLMIAHPPCTYLSRAGLRWMIGNTERMDKMIVACNFLNSLLDANIPQIAVENPLQHRFARQYIRKPDQRIEPFMFGHKERKNTYLWLKNLPFLNPTSALWNIAPPFFTDKRGHSHYWVDKLNNGHDRSRTFQGIAEAMAEQWRENDDTGDRTIYSGGAI